MSAPLPTTGPLGRTDYTVTNRDLLDNAYKQNAAINEVHGTVGSLDSKVQVLSVTVASHAKVIDRLDQIKSVAVWILCFVGAGGVLSAANWFKLWWSGH